MNYLYDTSMIRKLIMSMKDNTIFHVHVHHYIENQEFVNHYWRNNKLLPTVIEHSYSKTSPPCSVFSIVDRFVNEEDVFFSTDTTATSISEEDRALVASTDGIDKSSESEAFSTAITSTMLHLRLNSTELSPEMEAILLNESEEYKKTRDTTTRKGAEKYFQRAVDHARKQPDWKRLITERIKISKALFHLDMISIYQDMNKSEEAIEQLQYRAQDALNDVNEVFLTDRDKAFFYLTFAKLKRCSEACDLTAAKSYAKMALDINNRCGFEAHREEAEQLLRDIEQLL